MEIVICEDHVTQLKAITEVIQKYALIEDNGIHIALATTNPNEVLAYAQNHKVDCYFLDIDLGHEMTGMQLSSEIRKLDPICSIVFMTTHSEMAFLTFTYKVAALDFIIKDEVNAWENKVLDVLKEAHKRYLQIGNDADVNVVQIKMGSRIRNIDHDAIYFFEASPNPHKLVLHLHNEQIEFPGRLKDYENLSEYFYRCHKGCIVNVKHIEEIDTSERLLTMANGSTCVASSRLLRGLLKKFQSKI